MNVFSENRFGVIEFPQAIYLQFTNEQLASIFVEFYPTGVAVEMGITVEKIRFNGASIHFRCLLLGEVTPRYNEIQHNNNGEIFIEFREVI